MMREFRFAMRHWFHRPALALAAILTPALGIGAIVAAFSVAQAVLLRPLPFAAPDRLVALWESNPRIPRQEVSVADFRDWQARATSFVELAAYTMEGHARVTLSAGAGGAGDTGHAEHGATAWVGPPAETVKAAFASHNLFALLGVQASIGRAFVRSDEREDEGRVAVLSHDARAARAAAA